MPKLSEDEIKDFLTNFDYVMKLATLSSDGYPYVVPIWYFYEEEHFFILGRPNNKWVSNIYENQKISACIDSPSPPYARVSFRADAEVIDKEWFGEWEHLAHRYLGKEDGLLFAFCYGIVAVTYACYKFYLDNWRDEDDD